MIVIGIGTVARAHDDDPNVNYEKWKLERTVARIVRSSVPRATFIILHFLFHLSICLFFGEAISLQFTRVKASIV